MSPFAQEGQDKRREPATQWRSATEVRTLKSIGLARDEAVE
jgi:hypothetical protein